MTLLEGSKFKQLLKLLTADVLRICKCLFVQIFLDILTISQPFQIYKNCKLLQNYTDAVKTSVTWFRFHLMTRKNAWSSISKASLWSVQCPSISLKTCPLGALNQLILLDCWHKPEHLLNWSDKRWVERTQNILQQWNIAVDIKFNNKNPHLMLINMLHVGLCCIFLSSAFRIVTCDLKLILSQLCDTFNLSIKQTP